MPEIIGKLMKPDGAVTTELEKQVSQALVDLESNADIKAQLRELYIVGVRVRIAIFCLFAFVLSHIYKSRIA